jgi:hypothetical protein
MNVHASENTDKTLNGVRRVSNEIAPGAQPSGRRKATPGIGMSPAERSLRARAAAHRLHSLHDSRDLTANARRAFNDRLARQVDPDGTLPAAERQRRAECARRAYFASLAAKSARARRARRHTCSRRKDEP